MHGNGIDVADMRWTATAYAEPSGVVAVVGLGKIGLPLAMQYVKYGRRVIGCDVNPDVVARLAQGDCHIKEEPGLDTLVSQAVKSGAFSATLSTSQAVREARVVVVIVPVVVDTHHAIDFSNIDAATRAVGTGLRPGTLVIYETTLPVGTTGGRLRQLLEKQSGLVAGADFLLAYSPERVLSGRIAHDLAAYPKIVGGIDAASTDAAEAFYASVVPASITSMASSDAAEYVKLIETIYRDVNIALANEFAMYADRYGLDAHAAIAAANSQPYSHIHQPGVGVGGHCIPVYPYFLMQGAAAKLEIARQARIINDSMTDYAANAIEHALGTLEGVTTAILGVAYRGDVKETAFASAFLLRDALHARGAFVLADDPLYSSAELHALGFNPLSTSQMKTVQAIVVQADHSAYASIDFRPFSSCRILLDGRRAIKQEVAEAAGIHYISIGNLGERKRFSPRGG